MFSSFDLSEVSLCWGDFALLRAWAGVASLNINKISISELLEEAMRKYPRMHADDPCTRLDKSWTGFIGEEIFKECLSHYGVSIEEKPKIDIKPGEYDQGDVWVRYKDTTVVINVSSRKLSKNDDIQNFLSKQDWYIAFIPEDQVSQYVNRADLAVFVFLKPKSFKSVSIEFQGEVLECKVYDSCDFIIAGYISSTDISQMIEKGYVKVFKKDEEFKGIYNDMGYSVKNHTVNVGIPVLILRPLQSLLDKLTL